MINIKLAKPQPSGRPWWPEGASFAADFANDRYMKLGVPVSRHDAFLVTRASSRLAHDASGVWRSFSGGEPAITNLGLWVEPEETYYPVNSALSGAVAGVIGEGGALPSGWTAESFGTVEVVDAATGADGLMAITLDLRIDNRSGGGTAEGSLKLCSLPSAADDIWTSGLFFDYVSIAGDDDATNAYHVSQMQERQGGAFLNNDGGVLVLTPDGGLRQTITKTMLHASADSMQLFFSANNVLAGQIYNRRIRLGMPTVTKSAGVTSPMLTGASGNATRNADRLVLDLPQMNQELTIVFGNAGTAVVSGVSGSYEIVADPGRPVISRLFATPAT